MRKRECECLGGLISNAKFQCLGMSWGCCDNGLKEMQSMVEGEAESGREREKNLIL